MDMEEGQERTGQDGVGMRTEKSAYPTTIMKMSHEPRIFSSWGQRQCLHLYKRPNGCRGRGKGKGRGRLEPRIRPPPARLMCECSQQKQSNNNNDNENVDNNIKVNPK